MTNRVTFRDAELFWSQVEPYEPEMIPADDRNCPICHEEYKAPPEEPGENDVMAVRTQCGHYACLTCLSSWLDGTITGSPSNQCPICRHVLFRLTPGDVQDTDVGGGRNNEDQGGQGDDDSLFLENPETTHPSLDASLLRQEHRWLGEFLRVETEEHIDIVERSGLWNGDNRRATIRGNRPLPAYDDAPRPGISETRDTLRRAAMRTITQEVAWTLSRMNGFDTTPRALYYRLIHLCRCNIVVTMYALVEDVDLPPWSEVGRDLLSLVYQARRWIQQVVETHMD
ncbi:hypothetical protein H2201_003345 [Coniosporium apollinis]|uniref:RING-type domain-containing protein n=2 Tax=Coniosporium TaxID=2810619 RepID=A0ABQ9NXF2_9PEZI|nr:hypothetical protein H2199_002214 [Cladosporium sp. JES 115]KAJ9666423.1 hypothetical protein H2201_003345 [Coniosporium apollinis]